MLTEELLMRIGSIGAQIHADRFSPVRNYDPDSLTIMNNGAVQPGTWEAKNTQDVAWITVSFVDRAGVWAGMRAMADYGIAWLPGPNGDNLTVIVSCWAD